MEPADALALFFFVVKGMANRFIPDEIAVLTAGGHVANSHFDVWTSFAVIYAGAAIVYTMEFMIGSLIAGPLLRRLADRADLLPGWERTEHQLQRYLCWMIALGLFFPVIRHLVLPAAGICRLPLGRYMLAFLPASIVWSFHYVMAGYWYADHLDVIEPSVYLFSKITLAGIGVIATLCLLVRQLLRVIMAMPAGGMAGVKDNGSE